KGNEAVCKTSEDCHQYWSKLTEHSAEHRANAEKRVMEFDTIIGQKWVDDLARESKRRRRETSPLEKYSNCDNVESLIEDDVGDENDYDKTDDEFDESKIERLVFENVCSPGKTKPPKYHRSFRNAVDTLCKRFWTNRQGDAEISRKYIVLTYIVHKNQSESWRVCLADKDKCLAEKIFELEVPQKFEDDWVKLADIYKMMLLIET
ncbi:1865_t:CDS:2, partial [Rhizophagus irregularis]